MNLQKSTSIGLLLATCFLLSSAVMAETSASRGTIILRDKDSNRCTLKAPEPGQTAVYDLEKSGEGKCGYDTARTIAFSEMPSATKIFIHDHADCREDTSRDGFYIELKTTKKNTETSIIEVDFLTTFQPGLIIEPGLQLTRTWKKHGSSAADNTACVKIITSAQPPSP